MHCPCKKQIKAIKDRGRTWCPIKAFKIRVDEKQCKEDCYLNIPRLKMQEKHHDFVPVPKNLVSNFDPRDSDNNRRSRRMAGAVH